MFSIVCRFCRNAALALPLLVAGTATVGAAAAVPDPAFEKQGDFIPTAGILLTPNNADVFASSFTVMLWINPVAAINSGQFANLLSFETYPLQLPGWALYFQPNSTALHFTYFDQSHQYSTVNASAPLNLDTWTNVTIRSSPGAATNLFLNGQSANQTVAAAAGALPGVIYASSPFYQPANVRLSDLRVWNSALTTSDINTLQSREIPPIPEPATYALMAAGLALILATVARRKQAQRG